MIGVSSSLIIDSFAIGCMIPRAEEFVKGCKAAYEEMRGFGVSVKELNQCISRVRYTFSIIRSTGLAYEGEEFVYFIPCIMFYLERYGEKWITMFKHHVKMLVEPNYSLSIKIDEKELNEVLRYSKKIRGYYDLKVITSQLAVVNKSLKSIETLLESITLRDGARVHLIDYLSNIIKETLENNKDIEKIKHELEFRVGNVLNASLSNLNFVLELLVTLLAVLSSTERQKYRRPQYNPPSKIYIRVLRSYQDFYKEKLDKLREKYQKKNKNQPETTLNPSIHLKKKVSEELEHMLNALPKLFDNTRQYINTYYPTGKVNKNTRSIANRLLADFISTKLLLSPNSFFILSRLIENTLPQHPQ